MDNPEKAKLTEAPLSLAQKILARMATMLSFKNERYKKVKRRKTWRTYKGFLNHHNRINNEYEFKNKKRRDLNEFMEVMYGVRLVNRAKVKLKKFLVWEDKQQRKVV